MAQREVQNQTYFRAENEPPAMRQFSLEWSHASGHRTVARSRSRKERGLVTMKIHRGSGRWDLGGSHHPEDLKGVLAVGRQACQLLMPLQP